MAAYQHGQQYVQVKIDQNLMVYLWVQVSFIVKTMAAIVYDFSIKP